MRASALLVLGALVAFSSTACSAPAQKKPEPLATVAAVPAQAPPAWVASVAPTGSVKSGAQVLIRFKSDLVPLEQLEAADRSDVTAHFVIAPPLPGRFTIWTPRMVGFVADAPFPKASRFRVTLTSGLADLQKNKLAADYAWSFTTEPMALTVTGAESESAAANQPPVSLKPTITVQSNVEVDRDSLIAHTALVDDASGARIPVVPVPEPSPSGTPGDAPGAAPGQDETYAYSFLPASDLALQTAYHVETLAGVMPLHGNLPGAASSNGYLHTYGPLAFTGVHAYDVPGESDPSQGDVNRFVSGAPELRFTNPLDAKSALASVSVAPSPLPGVPLARLSDDGSSVQINANALAPGTHYTLRAAAGLKDAFGQSLTADATDTFETGDLTADLWAPSGLSIFPAGPNIALNIETTNLPERHFRSAYATVDPHKLVTLDPDDSDNALAVLGPAEHWPMQPATLRRNEAVAMPVPVRAKLGAATGMLAYGATARTIRYRDDKNQPLWYQPSFEGFVQLTDIGVFAQWFPGGGVVRAARLSDGSPIPGAKVEIYESLLNRVAKPNVDANQPACASGTTGPGGVWTLDAATFARCASTATSASSPPELLVIVRAGSDWAFVRTLSYSPYAGDFWTGWSAGAPNSYGTIVCDRQLYQPGEQAQFEAIGYFETNGVLARGRAASYDVTIQDPNGKPIALGSKALDPFGAFTIGWSVPKNAVVGYYTIQAKAANGEELDSSFRVAEFKPPNFKVALSLDTATVAAGGTVAASSKSTYLFGAPVSGGTTQFYVTRRRAYFVPKGWDAFSFGRIWFYPEEEPSLSADVLQKNVTLDAAGAASLNVQADSDLPFPTAYEVDAETTDASNLSVSDSKLFTAFPSEKLIGLRGDFLGSEGKPYAVSAIVTDPAGNPLAGEHLHLVLQRRESVSATQLVAGSETPHDAVHYVDVAQADVDSQSTPQSVNLTPDKSGTYRIRANFSDAKTDVTATDQFVWVTGTGEADWGPSSGDALTIKLDKDTYRPGDIATALIESPYTDADVFFAVIRHGILYQTSERVQGAAPRIRFTVTPAMLPNAAVEAVLVRRGPSLAHGIPPGLAKLARSGFKSFSVALDSKYLKVDVSSLHPSLEPGAKQHLTVRLRDAAGKPVRGEIALAVVDDAVLQLNGYRFPDLVKIVYAQQPISTVWGDNRSVVKLQSDKQFVDKGYGFGGGAMLGPAGTRVRTVFKPLAYWNGALRTGPDGTASADFALPDDLTTWRVMALALTQDARFGNGESTFIATKPLVTNPILPQFARPGDRFSAGVAVTDVAGKGGSYSIDASLAGDLAFVDGDTRTQKKSLTGTFDGLNQAFRFDVLVTGANDARETISTKLGANSDAFAVPVTVGLEAITESTVQTGTTRDKATVPLFVVPALPSYIGGLDVTLASTLLADAVEPARALLSPRPPFAGELASRIAIASDSLELARIYGTDPARAAALRNAAQGDLAALRTLALPDGGFAAYPGAKESELYSTAFIAVQLQQAKAAGFDVSHDLAHVKVFLAARLADPSEDCHKNDRDCETSARLEALETLVILGESRTDYLAQIFKDRERLGYYEQVELARLLIALPDWHAKGLALRDKLLEQVYFTGRQATVNTLGAFGESRVAGQAQIVGLLIDSGSPGEDVDRAFSSLLGMRQDGRWGCLCDDAEAMNAIALYAKRDPASPNFDATAKVGVETIAARFRGYGTTSVQKTIPMAQLPKGRSDVALSKSGTGTLHYVVAFRYGVLVTTPGIYNGIRIDRIVRAAGSDTPLASFGLPAAQPPNLAAAQVYDIEDRITTDHALQNVVVEDPLPGGLEAIDAQFQTSTHYFSAADSSWQLDYQQIYRDHVLAFASDVPAGVYAFHYLVRSVTPGDFMWPGARVSLQYAPDQFGRTASSRVTIAPAP